MLGQQAFFIREMVRRIAPSPAIAGWLVSNEMPLLGGPVEREYARAWGLVCADAIRAGGSDLPLSLGDGVWGREVTGRENGFRLADQLDIVDFFGPHSYPMGTDQTRQLSRAAFICELTDHGKPVVLEEFGVTETFAAPEQGAHYYRQTLHQSLLSGATGWIAWTTQTSPWTRSSPTAATCTSWGSASPPRTARPSRHSWNSATSPGFWTRPTPVI
jgi:endo-1,4-beta-mannosidase